MSPTSFTLDKIKYTTDEPTFRRAIALYESNKVTHVEERIRDYEAVVLGTKPYQVSVSARDFREADCDCYLGENGKFCKHMLALAIYVVKNGQPLTINDKKLVQYPTCSGKLGELDNLDLKAVKTKITASLRYIKGYSGPSRLWFEYQDSLLEGCRRLSVIISDFPVSLQTSQVLVDLLLRLDKKLSTGGVDDSDGTVGGFMQELVDVLCEYVKRDPGCIQAFTKLKNIETCFDWEKPLLELSKQLDQ